VQSKTRTENKKKERKKKKKKKQMETVLGEMRICAANSCFRWKDVPTLILAFLIFVFQG